MTYIAGSAITPQQRLVQGQGLHLLSRRQACLDFANLPVQAAYTRAMSDELRAALHRLVDELDDGQLPVALAWLAAERDRRSPADTRAALEDLYGQPLPTPMLARGRGPRSASSSAARPDRCSAGTAASSTPRRSSRP